MFVENYLIHKLLTTQMYRGAKNGYIRVNESSVCLMYINKNVDHLDLNKQLVKCTLAFDYFCPLQDMYVQKSNAKHTSNKTHNDNDSHNKSVCHSIVNNCSNWSINRAILLYQRNICNGFTDDYTHTHTHFQIDQYIYINKTNV